ncbi:MAG: oligosaccharide flippase family protein, partial [Magnetospirillum sp.]|nr:oligosaccharide flippase family protein [Magnetospirillum sp.]
MIFKDSLIYILSKLIPSGLGFATGITLSWLLSPEDYGLYGYGMAVATMVSTIGFEWLGLSFMRFKQKHGDDPRFMPTVMMLFLGLCALSLALMSGLAATMNQDRAALLLICTLGAWGYSYFEMAGRVVIANFQSSRYFWMNLVRNLGILAASIGLATLFSSPMLVLLGGFCAMLTSGLAFWQAPLFPRRFDPVLARQLFRYGMPMMATMTLYAIHAN